MKYNAIKNATYSLILILCLAACGQEESSPEVSVNLTKAESTYCGFNGCNTDELNQISNNSISYSHYVTIEGTITSSLSPNVVGTYNIAFDCGSLSDSIAIQDGSFTFHYPTNEEVRMPVECENTISEQGYLDGKIILNFEVDQLESTTIEYDIRLNQFVID